MPDKEIEEYLKHLKVQMFVVEQSLDLRELGEKSIHKTQTLVSDNTLYWRD